MSAATPAPPAAGPSWRLRGVRAAGVVLGGLMVLGALGLVQLGRSWDRSPSVHARPLPEAVPAPALAGISGVQVLRVSTTGGGGLLDLRYQVIDPERANAIHDPQTPPAIVDEKSGAVISQLLMGHMHTGTLHAGQTYYLHFANPGTVVRRRDRVGIVLGGARIEHALVG